VCTLTQLYVRLLSELKPSVLYKYALSPQVLVFMADAALLLFRQLANKIKACTPHCVAVLKASISLILLAVAQLKAHYPSNKTYRKEEIILGAFASLKDTLCEWIVDGKVIGGSVFGATLPVHSLSSWMKEKELKVM